MTEATAGADIGQDNGADMSTPGTDIDVPSGGDMHWSSTGREVDIPGDTDVVDAEVIDDPPEGDIDGDIWEPESWVDPVHRLGPAERTSVGGGVPSWWADRKPYRRGVLSRLLSPLSGLLVGAGVRVGVRGDGGGHVTGHLGGHPTGHLSGHRPDIRGAQGPDTRVAWMSAQWRAQHRTSGRTLPGSDVRSASGRGPVAALPSGESRPPVVEWPGRGVSQPAGASWWRR